jgi:hypothetical protein
MLGEFDAEALKGTGVQAGEKSFDDEFCSQIEARDLADDAWLQILFGGAHAAIISVQRTSFLYKPEAQATGRSTRRLRSGLV